MLKSDLVSRGEVKSSHVAPATEIVMSLLGQYADSYNAEQLQTDPRTYIYKTTSLNIPDEVDVEVVSNTGDAINLVLPYYGSLDGGGADSISDEQMGDISGSYFNFSIYDEGTSIVYGLRMAGNFIHSL